MELLLNIVWLVVGLSLIVTWSVFTVRAGDARESSLLPASGMQLTALLMLVILLFPVISLTDDIAMCTAPRDAERALRLHDAFDGSQGFHALLPPSAIAWMNAIDATLRIGPSRPVEQEAEVTVQLVDTRQPAESRPPPQAL